jgi:hypothetical protein
MFAEIVARHLPGIIAAVVLFPVLVFALAMFFEGVRKPRWQSARKAVGAPAAQPRPAPERVRPIVRGGSGLRHGIAAPHEHD